ncbi:MAG: hypothetical protein ACKVUS_00775, partial [Saprospiraceae bacterium]
MQKGILSDLLKTLTSREKSAFLRFVQSPYLAAKPETVRLAEQVLLPSTETERLHKTAAFPQIFGSERTYDDVRMRKVMEQLLRLLERFLVTEQRDREGFDFRLRLAALFIERKQEKLFRRLTALPLPFPAAETDWTAEHFEQASRWYQLLYDHRSATQREHDPHLYERVIHCQTVALLARRLRSACVFRTNQKEKADLPADYLIVWAQTMEAHYAELPLLQTLFAALRALQEPTDALHFAAFRDGLLQHPHCFSFADRRDLLVLAINFCSKRYNDGDKAWLDTQLDLYEHGLREGLLLENNWVTGYTFTNIATLALIARRYERLAQLLRDYRDKIAPRDRRDAVAFNEARLYHALRQYRPALVLLQQNTFGDLLLNLSAKTVQAKCFYELEEHDLLEAHLEALRKFIRRHKEVGYYGERYLNFIAALRRAVKADPAEALRLREEIAAMSVLAEKEWLLE